MIKIIVTGPESTGKTSLAQELAEHYKTIWIPEYSREYIGKLNRKYTYEDVLTISEKQREQIQEKNINDYDIVIFDTNLIVTKVWFLEAYGRYPDWLDEAIEKNKPKLYLLCYYDLEWKYDPIRENGSDERRADLFEKYRQEIEKIACDYQIIKGFKQERFNLAIKAIENKVKIKC